jgi:hypothetical protein
VLEDAAALAELAAKTFSDTFGVDIIPIDLHCASGFFDKRFVMRSVA